VEQVEVLRKLFVGLGNRLEFDVFDDTTQLVVRVIDRRTHKVLRSMPPEEFLELRSKIRDLVGMFIDESA
jgi:flagellar protein FlaG